MRGSAKVRENLESAGIHRELLKPPRPAAMELSHRSCAAMPEPPRRGSTGAV